MAHKTRRNSLKRKAKQRIKFIIEKETIIKNSDDDFLKRCFRKQCRALYECTNMSFNDYIKAYFSINGKKPNRSVKCKFLWDFEENFPELKYLI